MSRRKEYKTLQKGIFGQISKMQIVQLISFAVTFVTLLVMCRTLFHWLVYFVFNEPREDMGHGWFVPIVSLLFFWWKRDAIRKSVGVPSWVGFFFALIGMGFFWLGTMGDQVRIAHVGAIWLLWSILYTVWGKAVAMKAAFPVVFLSFTIPTSFLDVITVKLRFIISISASVLLNGIGIPVARYGTGLQCLAGERFSLDIADPCSGLRSIFALAALTAAYAYLTQKTLKGKWLLFLCSVPLAMLGNLARIFSIAVVARFFGQEIATGFYHDYSGFVVFFVAVLLMIWLGGLLLKHFPEREGEEQAEESKEAEVVEKRLNVGRWVVLVLLPVALMVLSHVISKAPPIELEKDDFLVERLSALPGYSIRYPFYCQNDQCGEMIETENFDDIPEKCVRCGGGMGRISLGEKNILPEDTRFLKATYYDSIGDAWVVAIVINGNSRQSIHRPEICLPAQGMSIENDRIRQFRLENGETLLIHSMDVRNRATHSKMRKGFGYFFLSRNHRAASHLKRILISVRDRAFARRVTRWSMVTILSAEPFEQSEERKEATEAFLSALFPHLLCVDETKEQDVSRRNLTDETL